MGRRGELFTRRVFVDDGDKTFFFNIKENRYGDLFLNLAESRKLENNHFDRRSLMIYREDISRFKEYFYRSLQVLNDSKANRDPITFNTDSGRRTYNFIVQKFKDLTFLQIEELRVDKDLVEQKQSIRLFPEQEEPFLQAFRGAIRFLENSERKMVVKLNRPKVKKRTKRKVTLKKSD